MMSLCLQGDTERIIMRMVLIVPFPLLLRLLLSDFVNIRGGRRRA